MAENGVDIKTEQKRKAIIMRHNHLVGGILLSCIGAMLVFTGCNPAVTIVPAGATLEVGGTEALQASSTSGRDASFVWISADVAVATVDQAGTVTGVEAGQTTVTARGTASGAVGQATITVNPPVVTLTPSLVTLEAGGTVPLQAASTSSRDLLFVWASDDPAVATVDHSGTVTGVHTGQTMVRVRGGASGSEGTASVTVNRPVITVMPSTVTIEAGVTETLQAASTSLLDSSFVWSSDDAGIAAVDPSGIVTGVNEGQTTVRAQGSSSGEEGLASITVTRPADALSELSVVVDTRIVPPPETLPPFTEGGPPRPLASIVDERGNQADFVENELILVSDDPAALTAFLARWEGELLDTVNPDTTDLDMPLMHLVRINTALGDSAQLEADLLALDPDARGATRVSSEAGLRLISANAEEVVAGATVGMNWVARGSTLATRFTMEAAAGPNGYNSAGDGYSPNAFNWNHLDTGSVQDIGVTEAWYLLAKTHRLSNKVKLAILDMGFNVEGNNDVPSGWVGISNVPFVNPIGTTNLSSCTGGAACEWHGTNVLGAAMGVPDNSFGAAGPAGPVAEPILIFTSYDFFTGIGAIVEARVAGARVVNMSYGVGVPTIVAWTVYPFEIATAAAAHSMVLCAAAGNDNKNVDAEDCFIVCWEETWHTPCENDGVLCVGGIARNSTSRAGNSNYGGEHVDIFAPYSVIVGPDPESTGTDAQEKSGTSLSSPYVAGVAALVMAANPSLSASQVRNILLSTAHESPDNRVRRYINAGAAVREALGAQIVIESPDTGASVHGGLAVIFESFVLDDGRGTPAVAWTSSRDGSLGSGRSLTYTGVLSYGAHTIRARATFPDGSTVQDSIVITVVNDPPTVTITSPANGASFYRGQPILLAATSWDTNEPGNRLADAQLSWYRDDLLVGHDHTRTIPAETLSIGSHVIRLTGTDGTNSDSKTVTITVNPNPTNLPPDEVTISSPAQGLVEGPFAYDTGGWYFNMVLAGSAHDPEDGNLTGTSLRWTRSTNGGAPVSLGTGASRTVKTYYTEGTTVYNVTLTAEDSAGNTTSVTHRLELTIIH